MISSEIAILTYFTVENVMVTLHLVDLHDVTMHTGKKGPFWLINAKHVAFLLYCLEIVMDVVVVHHILNQKVRMKDIRRLYDLSSRIEGTEGRPSLRFTVDEEMTIRCRRSWSIIRPFRVYFRIYP
jgi:hypothetical protein